MIDERQKAIEERLSKITPGPWELAEFDGLADNLMGASFAIMAREAPGGVVHTIGGLGLEEKANAKFIAAAPDDISYLLVALAEARELLERAHKWFGKYPEWKPNPDKMDKVVADFADIAAWLSAHTEGK